MVPEHLVVGPNEPDNEKFGELMQEFRMGMKLSRADAADKLNLSSEYIRLIEKGERVPAFGSMPKIFEAYGVKYGKLAINTWIIDDFEIEFTSRTLAARRESEDISETLTPNRHERIGRIVSLLSVADDETLLKVQQILKRS